MICITHLRQQLQELLLVLPNHLRELGVSISDLLQNWLKHSWLLLDKLAQMLEMWAVAQEIHVGNCSLGLWCACACGPSTALALLRGSLEEVDGLVASACCGWGWAWDGWCCACGCCGGRGGGTRRRSGFALEMFWDSVH